MKFALVLLFVVPAFGQSVANLPSGSGTGSVLSVATGCGLTGGPITGSGLIIATEPVNAQTGATYTYLDGDCGKLVTHSRATAIAAALPQANGSTFKAGWFMDIQNTGVGTLTVTPTTSTVDGAATLVLMTGQGARIVSNGTNYFTQRGVGGTQVPVVAISALPACGAGTEGLHYGVTDALTPTALAAVASGGAVHVAVYCDGTSWIVQ